MTLEALQAIMDQTKALLIDNERIVTPERLAAMKRLLDLFKSGASMGPPQQSVDLIQTLESLIAHEEVLQGGLAESLIESITKIQGRPIEMRAIALFL